MVAAAAAGGHALPTPSTAAAPQELGQMLSQLAAAFDGVQSKLALAASTSAAAQDAMERASAAVAMDAPLRQPEAPLAPVLPKP